MHTQPIKRFFTHSTCLQVAMQQSQRSAPVLGIELAPRENNTTIWSDKIQFQASDTELYPIIATLLNYREGCQFGYHGTEKDKLLKITNQQDGINFFMRQNSTDRTYYTTLDENTRFELVAVCTSILMDREQMNSANDILCIVRALESRRAQLNNRVEV